MSDDRGTSPSEARSSTDERDPLDRRAWERHALWWQSDFTEGADAEYVEQVLPLARELLGSYRRVVDVGCGEGQVSRAVASAGALEVVGLDPTDAQIRVARERGGGPRYARSVAEGLPLRDACADAVVACLVFEHITDHRPAIAEIARVLEPGGRFVLFLNHPLLQAPDSGWIIDHILEDKYWRIGPYLAADVRIEEFAPDVHLEFVHRPLSQYVNAMADHGLSITRMEEPPPAAGFDVVAPEYDGAQHIPRLLVLVAEKR